MRFALGSMVCVLLLTSLLVSPVAAELLINEILSAPGQDWNGDGEVDFKNDEWVEIVNTGPGVEDLQGVFLRDGSGDSYHFGFTGSLAAGEVRLVLGSDAVAWQSANGLSTTGLSLNNSGDRVELWRDIDTPRVLDALDAVDVLAHAAEDDRSMGRLVEVGTWVLFDALNPYTGTLQPASTDCVPSPGLENECAGSVPIEGASLSRVRARF